MKHFQVSGRKNRREDQAIQPIQQPAVTRQYSTRIFHGKNAFNQRLKKIANLSQDAQYSGKRDDFDRTQFRNQETRSEAATHHAPCHVPQGSFDGFPRTDLRRELSLAKISPGHISHSVAHHYHQENEKHPRATMSHANQQDPMGQQITEIDGAEKRPSQPVQSLL